MRTLLAGMSLIALLAGPAWAQGIKAENVWVRATAPGQKVAGAFMDLTSEAPVSLVGGQSPVAEEVELHTMSMKDGVMRMRRVAEIKLPEGQTVKLEPGGLHVMLIGLKAPLKEGGVVPITLHTRDAAGKRGSLKLEAAVRANPAPEHGHHSH